MTSPRFPSATILGYPRIGPSRELKRAVESYWAGKIDADELRSAERGLRLASYKRLRELGLTEAASIPESFSLYDQVLDVTVLLGAIPERFAGRTGYDLYFSLARGDDTAPPQEMTKWFDTNYHYLVPEIGPETPVGLADRGVVERFAEAREAGFDVRPALVGPVTYLALAKAADGAPAEFSPLDRLDDVVDAYAELLSELAAAGAEWVQFDEPALTSDNLPAARSDLVAAAFRAWQQLAAVDPRPSILVTTPYGDASQAIPALTQTGVEAIHAAAGQLAPFAGSGVDFSEVALVAGAIDGRNIWTADLGRAERSLQALEPLGAAGLSVSTTTSLQHVPYNTEVEKWDDPELDANLHEWLAFADQKVREVVVLAKGLTEGWGAVADEISSSEEILARRPRSVGVVRADVRDRVAAARESHPTRAASAARRPARVCLPGPPPRRSLGPRAEPIAASIRRLEAGAGADARRGASAGGPGRAGGTVISSDRCPNPRGKRSRRRPAGFRRVRLRPADFRHVRLRPAGFRHVWLRPAGGRCTPGGAHPVHPCLSALYRCGSLHACARSRPVPAGRSAGCAHLGAANSHEEAPGVRSCCRRCGPGSHACWHVLLSSRQRSFHWTLSRDRLPGSPVHHHPLSAIR